MRAAVDTEHDLGVEHRHERPNVAPAGGHEQGADHIAVDNVVRVVDQGRAMDAPSSAAGRCRVPVGERSTIGPISSNGAPNMSCTRNASPSRGQRHQHH
jgi:hypothetical protein